LLIEKVYRLIGLSPEQLSLSTGGIDIEHPTLLGSFFGDHFIALLCIICGLFEMPVVPIRLYTPVCLSWNVKCIRRIRLICYLV